MSTSSNQAGERAASESMPRLYTLPEACNILRISRWSLYQVLNRCELRSITIGSRRLVAASDLRAYIEARRQEHEK